MLFIRLLLCLISFAFTQPILADTLYIAAASNFTAPMKLLAKEFEQQSKHKVKLSFGSSGKLFAQIKHGAPYQLFFSADQDKPERLEQAGLVAVNGRVTYAIGQLVLWSNKPDFIDNHESRLVTGKFNRLALANPKLAPYGRAALETLNTLKLTQQTKTKWVQGENIAQTYQFVASDSVDLGFVALSQVMKSGKINKGSSWLVPEQYYQPIKQDVVLLNMGKNNTAARAFFDFIQGQKAQAMIKSYGYHVITTKRNIH